MPVQVEVSGMTCGSCSTAVQNVLGKLPGVAKASVGLLSNSAKVCDVRSCWQA